MVDSESHQENRPYAGDRALNGPNNAAIAFSGRAATGKCVDDARGTLYRFNMKSSMIEKQDEIAEVALVSSLSRLSFGSHRKEGEEEKRKLIFGAGSSAAVCAA